MSRHIDYSNPKRLRILSLVRRTPSISHQELADIVGLSTTGVHHHLVQLEKEGVITRSHEVGRPSVRNYYKPYRKAVKKNPGAGLFREVDRVRQTRQREERLRPAQEQEAQPIARAHRQGGGKSPEEPDQHPVRRDPPREPPRPFERRAQGRVT